MAKASAAASAMVESEGGSVRFEYDEEDFVRRALQCRNGIGLVGGGLRHKVVVGVL